MEMPLKLKTKTKTTKKKQKKPKHDNTTTGSSSCPKWLQLEQCHLYQSHQGQISYLLDFLGFCNIFRDTMRVIQLENHGRKFRCSPSPLWPLLETAWINIGSGLAKSRVWPSTAQLPATPLQWLKGQLHPQVTGSQEGAMQPAFP